VEISEGNKKPPGGVIISAKVKGWDENGTPLSPTLLRERPDVWFYEIRRKRYES
jgi:hypothetical protein